MKTLIPCFIALSLAVFPPAVLAKKGHHHKHHDKHHHDDRHSHHRDVVIVKEEHHSYHKSRLPEIATFAVIAGVSYAIINNTFYKKSGDEYRSVEKSSYR